MAAHTFLSPEWIEAVTALREELAERAPDMAQQTSVNVTVTGVPFGQSQAQAYIDTAGDAPLPLPGSLTDPDATITMDYETAKQIFASDDPEAVSRGFLEGLIRIDGDVAGVLIMFAGGISDEQAAFSEYVQQRLREITA